MCDAEWGGLQPQQSQNNVILAPPDPNFPKFAPPLYRYNCVRVHPNTFPQHMKVLKHFIACIVVCLASGWGWLSIATPSAARPEGSTPEILPKRELFWEVPKSHYHEVGHKRVSSIRDIWKDVTNPVRATDF